MAQPVGRSLLSEESRSGWRRPSLRWLLGAAALSTTTLIAIDLLQPPAEQRATRLALDAIELYREHLSPLLESAGVRCRFRPSCSVYGAAVVRRDGLVLGGARAAWRVLRCGPWTPAGTEDPPLREEPRSAPE